MGSAGGAITIDTPNCANDAAGMAKIRSVSNSKRIVRILNHLARSSFDCPVRPCRCGLRGVRGDASSVMARIPRTCHQRLCTTAHFSEMSQLSLLDQFLFCGGAAN